MTPDQIAAEIAEKAELAIELRNFWHMFSDANPFDGSADFPARMEAVGFCELCNVTDDDLEEAFAYERGIEPGGQVWKLTAIGKKIVEANNSGYAVATVCEADRAALLTRCERYERALTSIRDRQARNILPWTHEQAADEYARMLDADRYIARAALTEGT